MHYRVHIEKEAQKIGSALCRSSFQILPLIVYEWMDLLQLKWHTILCFPRRFDEWRELDGGRLADDVSEASLY